MIRTVVKNFNVTLPMCFAKRASNQIRARQREEWPCEHPMGSISVVRVELHVQPMAGPK